MPSSPVNSNATLHALTERLATHSRSLHPLLNSNLSSFSPQSLAAAASAYRQPAPPPQLPILQLVGRHQDIPTTQLAETSTDVQCPAGNAWPVRGEHSDKRCSRCDEEELDGFVDDVGVVLRREFDCWVEQCWTEAFHHLFTHTIPNLLIHLILTGSSPTFLRRQIVHGGPNLDYLFQSQMLDLLYQELELRLSGARPSEASMTPSSSKPVIPNPMAPSPPPVVTPRDGVCFHSLAHLHGLSEEDDDHGLCLCQLTTCLGCFHTFAQARRGPISLLPHELAGTPVQHGWTGGIESEAQAKARRDGWRHHRPSRQDIPTGQGFIRHVKPTEPPRPPPMFPHPQMTDVLAVEEHLRWRLKEMGATDPAVESRYGPSTNAPAALDGIELPEESEDGVVGLPNGNGNGKMKMGKVTRAKGKVRRVVNSSKKDKGDKGRICYLPKEWAEEEPSVRNTAIILTFRHFVKLLHHTATCSSPFSYPSYTRDIAELDRVHPIALFRRLAEPSVVRRKNNRDTRAWVECMDHWAEELGAREKTQGNKYVNEQRHIEAVEYYTRAISLDSKKTVYFSNRAVALNTLGEHEKAEWDCKHILVKDSKNGKAFYQRALARRGLGRWREAEADLKEVLRYQPGNESAKKLLGLVRGEVAKLPKQRVEDVMDF